MVNIEVYNKSEIFETNYLSAYDKVVEIIKNSEKISSMIDAVNLIKDDKILIKLLNETDIPYRVEMAIIINIKDKTYLEQLVLSKAIKYRVRIFIINKINNKELLHSLAFSPHEDNNIKKKAIYRLSKLMK